MSSSSSILPDPPVTRREVFAWASLDFANSGYTTVVLTAVFNAYFVSVVMDDVAHATLVWTLVLSASYLVVMFSAPFLGAYADAHRAKRPLLLVATLLCGAATLGLTQCGPGDLWPAAALLLVSNVAYATHQDLSAGFMRSLAGPGALGRLSGWGWAWGYLGGLLTLGLSLVWVSSVAQGVVPAVEVDWRAAWARLLRSRHAQADALGHGEHGSALGQFLWAVVFYQSGVSAVITLAAIYAQQAMGFGMAETIALLLVVNITASIGAAAFGWIQDRLGHRDSLSGALVLWIVMVLVAAFGETEAHFWLAANLAGLAMGASQSGARAVVGALSPRDHQAEAFGDWGVAVNLAAVMGPLAYGLTTWLTGNDHRLAILVTGLFFVVGLVLLRRVPFPKA
jgi:UMF1 family MFS transporter